MTARAFSDQAELVEASLELTRGRIRFAVAESERRKAGERSPEAFPEEFARAEVDLAERMKTSREAGVELPISWLADRLGLGPGELRLLWVLLAHELCAVSRMMLRKLNTENCADPTTETVRLVAFGASHQPEASRLLSGSSPLLLGGLIERTDSDAAAPDHRKTWKVARQVVALAHSDLSLDPELYRIAKVVVPNSAPLGIGGGGIEVGPECLAAVMAAVRDCRDDDRTLIVQGQPGSGRRSLLQAAASACGIELLEVDPRHLSRDPSVARTQLAAVARDCRLFGRVPLLRDLDQLVENSDAGPAPTSSALLELVASVLRGSLVLATTNRLIPGGRLHDPQIVEMPPLTGLQRTRLWARALPHLSIDDVEVLADMYPVAPALIDASAAVARAQLRPDALILDPRHVRIGLRSVLDGRLAGLATRLEITQDWDALVLPADQRQAIDELIARVRQRRTVYETWGLAARLGKGLGISTLFSGPPGTGKTMAAGLIANALATDVYQVDMSKITSKWIGETEKNLGTLFDAAEAGQVMLLFDEADALFGKRTEVKTSNDRHANQETNYLLQRLEAFRGICVLTTNNASAIDEAFRRRIALHVRFPMPEVPERAQLWGSMLRDPIPREGPLDLTALARRYEMSGGFIRNAVLRAAFFAANEGSAVTSRHLFRAAELEYQAMGRILPSSL